MLKRPWLLKANGLLLAALLLVSISVTAQVLPPPPPKPIPPEAAHPKIETVLQLLAERRREGVAAAETCAQVKGIHLVDDSVRVIIEPLGEDSERIDRAALEALGGVVDATSRNLMRATIPLLQLIPAANTVNGIRFIRRPYEPKPVTISQGVSLTGADEYHDFGYHGQGAKVAVIDLGFDNLTEAIANGEFGSGSGYGGSAVIDATCTHDYTGEGLEAGTAHGTGVAEIVYDMAPQATLCLMKVGDSLDLENAKDDAITRGAHIINHSVAWFNTNFYDGTGTVADIAADARDNGILWVNAAGNEADPSSAGHWQSSFSDGNSNRWHNFFGSDECNNFNASTGETIKIYLTWDAWPQDAQDYNLYLYSSGDPDNWVDSSENVQNGSQPPTERIIYNPPSAGSYCFAIYDADAPVHPDFEIFMFKDPMYGSIDLEHHHAESSIPAPGNDEKVLTVGAIYYGDWSTGPQESFSSQGLTNASKFASSRTKPDLMGPDGVASFTYGASSFYGTSAASPHIAGAAALLLSEDPSRTASDLQTKLESDAIDMGVAGKDNIYGSGRLNLIPQAPGTEAVFRVTKEGNVYADRAYYGSGFYSGYADIAEYIKTSEPVAPGDLVELDPERPGRYRKSRKPYSTLVAGVISTAPGITMGGIRRESRPTDLWLSLQISQLSGDQPSSSSIGSLAAGARAPQELTLRWTIVGLLNKLESSPPLLALMGVVPVKATAENGPIRPGDLLVSSSLPGYVMRCSDPGKCEGGIVGKALGALEEGQGLIELLVMR